MELLVSRYKLLLNIANLGDCDRWNDAQQNNSTGEACGPDYLRVIPCDFPFA